ERFEEKWSANFYKYVFFKFHLGLEIVLEIHTQLIAEPRYDHWSFVPFNNHLILAPQDELLYLAYHYAHQHTLLKPKWLHDIFLISKKSPELWTDKIWQRAADKQLYSALLLTAQALKIKYKMSILIPTTIKSLFTNKLLSLDFIENPDRFPIKYYVTKHTVKDSFLKALAYDFRWTYFFIKKRLFKKHQQ
ncbi:MAG: hypothetical protein IT287_00750, partial [Bdellovibrionaceae bacterium]|nr:hypothetical protein [Pseudobdellovibrionaceae bacterium]